MRVAVPFDVTNSKIAALHIRAAWLENENYPNSQIDEHQWLMAKYDGHDNIKTNLQLGRNGAVKSCQTWAVRLEDNLGAAYVRASYEHLSVDAASQFNVLLSMDRHVAGS